MDQSSPELPSPVELPKAEVKSSPKLLDPNQNLAPAGRETLANVAVEQGQSQAAPATPVLNTQSLPTGLPISDPVSPTAGLAQPAMLPMVADDVDLIEKEWVVKAKQIVAQTRDDPYKQNNAISQVKADYLKKRFNKEVKLTNS